MSADTLNTGTIYFLCVTKSRHENTKDAAQEELAASNTFSPNFYMLS